MLEDPLAEGLRRGVSELLIEGEHHHVANPGAPQERQLVLQGRQGAGRAAQEDRLGVLREGHHRGLRPERLSPGHIRLEDRLVSKVHPVEHPDAGHGTAGAGLQALN